MRRSLPLVVLALAACSHPALVSLRAARPVAPATGAASSFDVVTSAIAEPIALAGGGVAYTDLGPALGAALCERSARAAPPREPLDVTVEVVRAHAEVLGKQVRVVVDLRATARRRATREYAAQHQAHCQETGAREGADAWSACFSHLADDVGGWLARIEAADDAARGVTR